MIASCFDVFVIVIKTIQAHYVSIKAEARATQAHLEHNIQEAHQYLSLTSYNDDRQEIQYQVLYGLQLLTAKQNKVKHKVQSIVQTLHEGGFVHGDIRDTNILVNCASLVSRDVKVQIIDFDWAGRLGEAKYSLEINCETVRRPAGLKGREMITQQHDIEMISYLFVQSRNCT